MLKKFARKIAGSKISVIFKVLLTAAQLLHYRLLCLKWALIGKKRPTAGEISYVVKNVTFIYKSFKRQKMAKRLFWNIQKYYPGAAVIIADDSGVPLDVKSEYAKIITLPFNSGLSCGLNAALTEVKTPYVMRLDDDELLTPYTDIGGQLDLLEQNENIDLVAVQACSALEGMRPKKAAEEYYEQTIKNAPKSLLIPHMTRLDDNRIVVAKSPNTFLARTEKLREVGYDNNIRMIDHHEFFFRAAGVITACMDESAFVFHYHNRFDREYNKYRADYKKDLIYIREKHKP